MSILETIRAALAENLVQIVLLFGLAQLINSNSLWIARRLYQPVEISGRTASTRQQRIDTLHALLSNSISILAFVVAVLLSLSLYVRADTLLWVVGLFSAAFGLGARPFISDFLTGITFMFEDTFDVGDKIELPLFPQRVEGVVEAVTLRITRVRGMSGELFTMPNGDIRLVRNFSRGKFSPASVKVSIPAEALTKTLDTLETLAAESMTALPNLIEPWQVFSETGELGEKAELTVLARAKFGKGAEMRTRMLAFLQEHLHHADITVNASPPASDVHTDVPPPTQPRSPV